MVIVERVCVFGCSLVGFLPDGREILDSLDICLDTKDVFWIVRGILWQFCSIFQHMTSRLSYLNTMTKVIYMKKLTVHTFTM